MPDPTRRSFLKALTAVPIAGPLLARHLVSKPKAAPFTPPAPIYGFDETISLRDVIGKKIIAREPIRCGDFVTFDATDSERWSAKVASVSDKPAGVAVRDFAVGDEVSDYVLVQGLNIYPYSNYVRP